MSEKSLRFVSTVPVFSAYIARGMAMGFGALMAIFGTIIIISIANGNSYSGLTPDIYYAIGMVIMLFVITYVVLWVLFPRGFMYEVVIDDKGIAQNSVSPNTKRVNVATMVAGVLAKSPGAIGAGLLAQTGDSRYIPWKQVKVIRINEKNRYCYFSKGKFTTFPIGFFCPEEHFGKVKELVSFFAKI